ncbi:hypothetical protein [Paenibacillus hamazuiensis]|uniref:hypothetical protein n=1 Tax=Paenibacillus hamazuiensis TaxID=2936508 RepID=UPI00200CBF13|nr:hypothetical protein [Paenibacillus hamazuiensis]
MPIQYAAWVILVFLWASGTIGRILIPNVNNTPAFVMVSIWLLQTLLAANLTGYLLHRLLKSRGLSGLKWKWSLHAAVSAAHIGVIALLIFCVAGFEDL